MEKQTWLDKEPTPSQLRNKMLKSYAEDLGRGHGGRHSALGDTLKLTIQRLERAGVPYVLTAFPGEGYYLKGNIKGEYE